MVYRYPGTPVLGARDNLGLVRIWEKGISKCPKEAGLARRRWGLVEAGVSRVNCKLIY